MATTRPFAFNTGSTIAGAEQLGNLAIGYAPIRYDLDPGGAKWWMGPDEDKGYIIAHQSVAQPVEPGITPTSAKVGFWRSKVRTDNSFVSVSNVIPPVRGVTGFTNATDAKTWLNANGYWTDWNGIACTNYVSYDTYSAQTGAVLSTGGTDIGNHGDDIVTAGISIGFDFYFYGSYYNTVNLSSNGNIQFITTYSTFYDPNFTPLPDPSFGPTILQYWSDLTTVTIYRADAGIFVQTTGLAPNRVFSAVWKTQYYDFSSNVDFEVKLYETTNQIKIITDDIGSGESINQPYILGLQKDSSTIEIYSTGYTIASGVTITSDGICAPASPWTYTLYAKMGAIPTNPANYKDVIFEYAVNTDGPWVYGATIPYNQTGCTITSALSFQQMNPSGDDFYFRFRVSGTTSGAQITASTGSPYNCPSNTPSITCSGIWYGFTSGTNLIENVTIYVDTSTGVGICT